MRIELFVVGKTNHDYLTPGIDDYVRRTARYIPFSLRVIADAKKSKNLSQELQKTEEGKNLLATMEPSDFVVLLDEHGKELASTQLATYIEKKMQTVGKRLVFVIGGPYGFSDEVKARANDKLSLSKMTFPHDLVRLLFIEQLYRAFTIMHNEPYHHP